MKNVNVEENVPSEIAEQIVVEQILDLNRIAAEFGMKFMQDKLDTSLVSITETPSLLQNQLVPPDDSQSSVTEV